MEATTQKRGIRIGYPSWIKCREKNTELREEALKEKGKLPPRYINTLFLENRWKP